MGELQKWSQSMKEIQQFLSKDVDLHINTGKTATNTI